MTKTEIMEYRETTSLLGIFLKGWGGMASDNKEDVVKDIPRNQWVLVKIYGKG